LMTWLVPHQGREAGIAAILRKLDLLIASHRVPQTPLHGAERAFRGDAMQTPSFHLRFRYSGGLTWASSYPIEDLPPNLRSFYEACRKFGLQPFVPAKARTIPAGDALALVNPQRET